MENPFAKRHDTPASTPRPEAKISRRAFLGKALAGTAALGAGALGIKEIYEKTEHRPSRHTPLQPAEHPPTREQELFRIDPNKPSFNQLREYGVFPRDHKWEITASSEAFHAIGKGFVENPETAHLLEQEEVHLLIPASGVLLSPLEIAFQFAERSPKTKRVRLTMTEVDPEALAAIDTYVKMLDDACRNMGNLTVETAFTGEPIDENTRPTRKTIRFDYTNQQQKKIEMKIEFEYFMSGENYLRAESAAESDIIVMHDVNREQSLSGFFTKEAGDLYTILHDADSQRFSSKPHYAVTHRTENTPDSSGMGQNVMRLNAIRYGCGENHLDADTPESRHLDEPVSVKHGVDIIRIDTIALHQINAYDTETVQNLFLLTAVPEEFEEKILMGYEMSFEYDFRKLLRNLRNIRHQEAKARIYQNLISTKEYLYSKLNDMDTSTEKRTVLTTG